MFSAIACLDYFFIEIAAFSVLSTVLGDNVKCIVLKEGDKLTETPPIGGRECIEILDDTNKYCLEYDCPKPECADPITPEKGCPYCKGMYD